MNLTKLILIVITIISLSTGQVLFKIASKTLDFSYNGVLNSLLNKTLVLAIFIYFAATIMWLFVLKNTPLNIAYPFVALAFVIVPILAHFFLGEKITLNTMIGASIIIVGVWISNYNQN